MDLTCWKCGESLGELPLPLARREECRACGADLHVCRMCEFYDTSVAKSCREPVAEEVKDKERANFCDYFRPRPDAYAPASSGAADAARAELEALFGVESPPPQGPDVAAAKDRERGEAEAAKRRLDAMFGLDEGDED